MSTSVYAKSDDISIETKRRDTRHNPRLYKRTHQPWFESDKTEGPLSGPSFRRGVQPIVLVCFDIIKHLRRSGTVDKIKKYRRDSAESKLSPRKSLSVFLIILSSLCKGETLLSRLVGLYV